MTSLARRVLAPLLVIAACVGIATALAVPEDTQNQDLSPEEIARIDAFVERFRHGQRLMGSGRDADAEQVFRDLIAEEPGAAAVHHALGTLLRFRDRPEEATRALLRAAELAPDDPVILRDAGIDLLQRGRPADAEPHFAKARALWPEEVEVLVLHATTLRAVGRLDEARSAYRLAVAAGPDSVDARVGLGAMLVDTKPERALELVTPLPHNFADVSLVHGLALESLDRGDEAREHLVAAVLRSPDAGPGFGISRQAVAALGRLVAGEDLVDAATRWRRKSGEPPALEPSLALAEALAAQGKFAEALGTLDLARSEAAEPAVLRRAFLVRAALLLRSDRIRDARAAFDALASQDVVSPERAMARRVLGTIDDAALVEVLGTKKARRNDATWAAALAARVAGDAAEAQRLETETRRLSEPAGEFPGLLVR